MTSSRKPKFQFILKGDFDNPDLWKSYKHSNLQEAMKVAVIHIDNLCRNNINAKISSSLLKNIRHDSQKILLTNLIAGGFIEFDIKIKHDTIVKIDYSITGSRMYDPVLPHFFDSIKGDANKRFIITLTNDNPECPVFDYDLHGKSDDKNIYLNDPNTNTKWLKGWLKGEPPSLYPQNKVLSQKVSKPEVSKPEVSKPEVSKPEVSKPEVSKPEVSKPEAVEVDTIGAIKRQYAAMFRDTFNKEYDVDLLRCLSGLIDDEEYKAIKKEKAEKEKAEIVVLDKISNESDKKPKPDSYMTKLFNIVVNSFKRKMN